MNKIQLQFDLKANRMHLRASHRQIFYYDKGFCFIFNDVYMSVAIAYFTHTKCNYMTDDYKQAHILLDINKWDLFFEKPYSVEFD